MALSEGQLQLVHTLVFPATSTYGDIFPPLRSVDEIEWDT